MAKITDLPLELFEMIMTHLVHKTDMIDERGFVGLPALRVSRLFRDTFARVFMAALWRSLDPMGIVKAVSITDLVDALRIEKTMGRAFHNSPRKRCSEHVNSQVHDA